MVDSAPPVDAVPAFRPRPAHLLVAGPPDAPAIVFIHGVRLCRTFWTPQVEALGGEFRAIAMDLPAHGHRADETFSLRTAAEAVAETIRTEAHDGQAIVVGLSLGGYVAMELASRRPDLVRGLVLSGSTAEPTRLRALPYLALGRLMGSVDEARLDRLNARLFRTRYPSAIAEEIVGGGFWWKGGTAALSALAGERFIPRLAAYPGRTLIVNGEYDLPFRLFAGAFARAAQDARRVRIAGAGHLANLDRPAAFNAAIRSFARSLQPSLPGAPSPRR